MPLHIRHHHRAPGSPGDGTHRWVVDLEDAEALEVELPPEERAKLHLSDAEIHGMLPSALDSYADRQGNWDSAVRLYADHFRG
jgi:hypothetical protein